MKRRPQWLVQQWASAARHRNGKHWQNQGTAHAIKERTDVEWLSYCGRTFRWHNITGPVMWVRTLSTRRWCKRCARSVGLQLKGKAGLAVMRRAGLLRGPEAVEGDW